MIRKGRMFGFALCTLAASLLFVPARGVAGDNAGKVLIASAAPLDIPHQLDLDARAARKRAPSNFESSQLLEPTPGLAPLPFPKNSDLRARILTPQLRRTPVVGWIAANLYRDLKDGGWCVEIDPGEGEYIVFYRVHLK
ncbi:MAG: hypothetical protein ABI769_09990 [Pseudomonadota bacterium]